MLFNKINTLSVSVNTRVALIVNTLQLQLALSVVAKVSQWNRATDIIHFPYLYAVLCVFVDFIYLITTELTLYEVYLFSNVSLVKAYYIFFIAKLTHKILCLQQ